MVLTLQCLLGYMSCSKAAHKPLGGQMTKPTQHIPQLPSVGADHCKHTEDVQLVADSSVQLSLCREVENLTQRCAR